MKQFFAGTSIVHLLVITISDIQYFINLVILILVLKLLNKNLRQWGCWRSSKNYQHTDSERDSWRLKTTSLDLLDEENVNLGMGALRL